MLKRSTKSLFYAVAGPAMRINAMVYRAARAPKARSGRIHLGPGQKNYIPGWINCDANIFTGKADAWIDLNARLPFLDNSIGAAYSHHVVEHLRDLEAHLRDVFRVLRPGGVYRVGGPHGDTAIRKFVDGDLNWFSSWPDDRRSIGGRLENYLMCRGEHLTVLTESFLRELLEDAGFGRIESAVAAHSTHHPELFSDVLRYEHEEDPANPQTLILEAVKPI